MEAEEEELARLMAEEETHIAEEMGLNYDEEEHPRLKAEEEACLTE